MLTFSGEIEDTCCIYHAMCQFKRSDQNRVGILGFSQGARIMAAVLDKIPKLHCAVSWSGACQEHAGIFENWYQCYYLLFNRISYSMVLFCDQCRFNDICLPHFGSPLQHQDDLRYFCSYFFPLAVPIDCEQLCKYSRHLG